VVVRVRYYSFFFSCLGHCPLVFGRGLDGGSDRPYFYRRGGRGHVVEDCLVGGICVVGPDRRGRRSLENCELGRGASFHFCA
jgi:hypothetical protein